jgi:hypothetical protein
MYIFIDLILVLSSTFHLKLKESHKYSFIFQLTGFIKVILGGSISFLIIHIETSSSTE